MNWRWWLPIGLGGGFLGLFLSHLSAEYGERFKTWFWLLAAIAWLLFCSYKVVAARR